MKTHRDFSWTILPVVILICAAAALAGGLGARSAAQRKAAAPPAARDDAAAKAAFLAAYSVFMHPRCMNCHPAGDIPLQGDDSHPHTQNVQRGGAGMGKYALKCLDCHQLENVPGANMPPGAPNWHLPPPNMKMVFEGKSAGELCRQLKDPKQNGGRSVERAIEHIKSDKLVMWGWAPGEGRSVPAMSHAEFSGRMQEWIAKGAACPE
ncbi:MAG TPA: hypothetical protein VGQ11_03415 [Candidatus Acidoferrales bacterium]|jgi:hypothetical protein|nr:hypothetical protein [Candidatus Acidoferrales bacterium]